MDPIPTNPNTLKPVKSQKTRDGMVAYEVESKDSLTSVALRFDLSVTELKRSNKLIANQLCPGKILYIPEENFDRGLKRLSSISSASNDSEMSSSSQCRDLERSKDFSDMHQQSIDELKASKHTVEEVKHFLGEAKGNVSGTLLITTNTFIFIPCVSDKFVLDQPDYDFGFAVPVALIARFEIVDDVNAMTRNKYTRQPPPTMYRGPSSAQVNGNLASAVEPCNEVQVCPKVESGSLTTETNGHLPENLTSSNTGDVNISKDIKLCKSPEKAIRDLNMGTDEHGREKQQFVKIYDSSLSSLTKRNFSRQRLDSIKEFSSSHDDVFHSMGIPALLPSSEESASYSPVGNKSSFSGRRFSGQSASLHLPLVPSCKSCKSLEQLDSDFPFRASGNSAIFDPMIACYCDMSSDFFSKLPEDRGSHTKDLRDLPPMPSLDGGKTATFDLYEDDFPEDSPKDYRYHVMNDSLEEGSGEEDQVPTTPTLSQPINIISLYFGVRVTGNRGNFSSFANTKDIPAALFKTNEDMVTRKPAQYSDGLPMYLCIVIGKPRVKLPDVTYPGGKKAVLQSKYWFSISRQRVPELYAFIMRHFSARYGNEDEINEVEMGFEELSVTASEIDFTLRDKSVGPEGEEDPADLRYVIMPELTPEESDIVGKDEIKMLVPCVPKRFESSRWQRAYSNEKDGTSLKTLYRKLEFLDCPVLIVIKDSYSQVFGAILSDAPKVKPRFFGTGETLLFSFMNGFQKFTSTGLNDFFINANISSLCIGAGEGRFGLYLDEDLNHGRTQSCSTFKNKLLTEMEDFFIRKIEVWYFVN